MDLSVIIVNYYSAAHALGAVASLLEQTFFVEDNRPGKLEILVVDNTPCDEEAKALAQPSSQVKLLRNETNLGYGAAANRGFRESRGRYLCVLNPDVRVLPGALNAMVRHLMLYPEVGAVTPRFWWHEERQFMMPPNDDPTLPFLALTRLGPVIPGLGCLRGRWWLRRAVAYWRTDQPLSIAALCGACILTRRSSLEKVGGFDPGYFLYYEDADWSRRFRSAGYRLAYVPDAEVIHYYDQTPKSDRDRSAAASEARFYAKHYGWRGRAALAIVDRLEALCAGRRAASPPCDMIFLGQPEKPPLLRLDGCQAKGGLLIEVSHSWTFAPAAGAFLERPECELPLSIWDRLQPGAYYARIVDLATHKPLRNWSWQKN
jgi:GT2 family glycosyltransferase